MRFALIVAFSVAAGCATCRDHAVFCGVGAAFVAGAIVASSQHSSQNQPPLFTYRRPVCSAGPC